MTGGSEEDRLLLEGRAGLTGLQNGCGDIADLIGLILDRDQIRFDPRHAV